MEQPTLKKPTKEAIGAALSAYRIPTPQTGGMSEEMETFINVVLGDVQLAATLQGLAAAMLSDGQSQSATHEEMQRLIDEARPHFMSVLKHTVCMFFWIGWHARGAQEDQDELERLAGS